MRKTILWSVLGISLLTSCLKEKDYTCECTYVPTIPPNPIGTPNKVETLTIKARLREQAADDCSIDNEGKYANQFYRGTCILKD
jgi:hypothetical protein